MGLNVEGEGLEGLPENMQSLCEGIGFYLPGGDEVPDEVIGITRRMAEGHCMTCNAPLGANAVLCVDASGIIMAYCCTACLQDMAVTQWIQEQFDDILMKIKFRGGAGDEAPDQATDTTEGKEDPREDGGGDEEAG